MPRINHLAVLVSAVLQMALGFVWYDEAVFGRIWAAGIGLDLTTVAPSAWLLPSAFALSLLVGYGMALLLAVARARDAWAGLRVGGLVGVLLIAPIIAIHHAFAQDSIAVMLVDAGNEILSFALLGLLLGAWQPRTSARAGDGGGDDGSGGGG